jgi:hypothetical protein
MKEEGFNGSGNPYWRKAAADGLERATFLSMSGVLCLSLLKRVVIA